MGIPPRLPSFSVLEGATVSKRNEQVLDRMTNAKLGPVFMIPLDQIKQLPEDYRHRAESDLDPDNEEMEALRRSLITAGQKDPAIVYRVVAQDGTESFILVAGHRRLRALGSWQNRTSQISP